MPRDGFALPRFRILVRMSCSIVLAGAGIVPAIGDDSVQRATASTPATLATDTPPSTRPATGWEPQFFGLRYNEDFSYLEKHPEARRGDPLMHLKNIDLGDRWRLDLGGEFRLRVENRANRTFGLVPRTANTQQNYREMVHVNVKHGKLFRLFAQGIVAHVEDQDGPFQPTQENHGDLHQLFADYRLFGEDVPLTLRLGRQELYYGHDRLVGAFEWVSTRRRFDAAKLFYTSERWDIDAFWARPVVVERKGGDDWNDDYNFYGIYNTFKRLKGHGLDLYFFGVDRSDLTRNPNGHLGGRSTYTLGTRLWGTTGPWDYDTELAGQFGRWAGDHVQAWFWEADAGYTFKHACKPRIGAGFALATGDDNPNDRHVGTWDQLFTYDHVCISIQDLIGRQNITRTYVMFDVWPVPDKLKASAYFHVYWLNADTDFYYDAGAVPIIRDSFGHHGSELGQALEIVLEWKLTRHASMMFGFSHFWDDQYFHRMIESDDDPNFFFVQYQYKF